MGVRANQVGVGGEGRRARVGARVEARGGGGESEGCGMADGRCSEMWDPIEVKR